MYEQRLVLVGCGILRREIDFLVDSNGWPVDTHFLDAGLHSDLDRLSSELGSALEEQRGRRVVVFYGDACHPRIDHLVSASSACRTSGQNCVEMLCGPDLFRTELEQGAYFLLEAWACDFDRVITETFGWNDEVTREIFRNDRQYLLGVRTPCSGDFAVDAEAASRRVGLPLRWVDVTLDHLQSVLQATIAAAREA